MDAAQRTKFIAAWKVQIDRMDQMDLASLWRNAPAGHPCFDTVNWPEIHEHFKARFASLGGMTPAVSKAIGWKD